MCNGLQAKLCRMVIERENNKTASINSVASTTSTSSLETATTSTDNDELEDTCSLINNATIVTSDALEIDDGDNSSINTERDVERENMLSDNIENMRQASTDDNGPPAKRRPRNSYLVDVIKKSTWDIGSL